MKIWSKYPTGATSRYNAVSRSEQNIFREGDKPFFRLHNFVKKHMLYC